MIVTRNGLPSYCVMSIKKFKIHLVRKFFKKTKAFL